MPVQSGCYMSSAMHCDMDTELADEWPASQDAGRPAQSRGRNPRMNEA